MAKSQLAARGNVVVLIVCCSAGSPVFVLRSHRERWTCPRCKSVGFVRAEVTLGVGGALPHPSSYDSAAVAS